MLTRLGISICVILGICGSLSAAPPNIVLIVADDLGSAEVGCYGQKLIRTPSIDRMAAGGMKFAQFYAGNAVCAPSRCCLMTGKHAGHAAVRNNKATPPEGQHPLPADEITVAELVKAKGYATGAAGKWGLGMWDTTGSPLKQGFDHFFGYNCQAHAHSHYPTYLYRDGKRFELPGNDKLKGDTHSHDLFEKEALAFIESNRERPFFLYLPFTIPHVAIQVPEDSLAEYRGKFGDDPPYDGTIKGKTSYLPHPAPHAGYAAMVTRMDRSVGRILDKLRDLKLDSNTLVLFTSDNGPTHNVGGADSTFFKSAGTLRGLKGSLYEGGIRVPFVAYWPGTVKPGTVCDEPFYFPDVLPTLCELAGSDVPTGVDGVSIVPTLLGRPGQKHHEFLYWEFPAYGGQQAVRAGDWKAVRQNLSRGGVKTELYDLKADPSESVDVAGRNPDVLRRLEQLLAAQHVPTPDFPLPAIDGRRK
jgi:arylsulfatase